MDWISWMSQPEAWTALVVLAILEIVLGIDNIIFISILADKLPEEKRAKARFWGLALAMITRIILLLSLTWLMSLTKPLFTIPLAESLQQLFHVGGPGPHATEGAAVAAPLSGSLPISGKDLILFFGGLFLIWKATKEIHHKLEEAPGVGPEVHRQAANTATVTFGGVLVQIALMDIIFSLDSVITAVGMAQHIPVMVFAVIIAVVFMMFTAGPVSNFVSKHPTVKVLALSFLILVGTALVAEGLHFHIPKGYIYFAMAFSVGVEMVNIRVRKKYAKPSIPGPSTPTS